MYPEPPPLAVATSPSREVDAVRRTDAAQGRGLYFDVSCLGPGTVRELTQAGAPAATAEVLARQDVEIAAALVDIGFNRQDTAQLAALARGFKASLPSVEQRAAFHREALTALRDQYGAQFDTVFRDAKALAQRDPRFTAFLEVSTLGDQPFVIKRFAELASTARAKGRL